MHRRGIYEGVLVYWIQPFFADIHIMSLSYFETTAGRGPEISADTDELYLHSDDRLLAQSERVHA